MTFVSFSPLCTKTLLTFLKKKEKNFLYPCLMKKGKMIVRNMTVDGIL